MYQNILIKINELEKKNNVRYKDIDIARIMMPGKKTDYQRSTICRLFKGQIQLKIEWAIRFAKWAECSVEEIYFTDMTNE